MANFEMTTLTPLHIGSGDVLHGDYDYLYFRAQQQIALLDHQKVPALIPANEDAVQQWLRVIGEEGDLLAWLQSRRPGLQPEELALPGRIIQVKGEGPKNKHQFHTFLQSGRATPLVPGSSVKGALRTVFFADGLERAMEGKLKWEDFARKNPRYEEGRGGRPSRGNKWYFKDQKAVRAVFGANPNAEWMRFLMPGDVEFGETVCRKCQSLNLRGKEWVWKPDSVRFLEVIPEGQKAELSLRTRMEKGRMKGFREQTTRAMPEVQEILGLIRAHTGRLLAREMDFWQNQAQYGAADAYVYVLEDLLRLQGDLREDECILRLGYGSGYTWMTGGWAADHLETEDLECLGFYLRNERFPNDPPFPKTRAIVGGHQPLGLVKLRHLG